MLDHVTQVFSLGYLIARLTMSLSGSRHILGQLVSR